jgi:hypothetical protein
VATLKVMATYEVGENLITLSDDWDLSSKRDLSILLHELGHFVQDKAGVSEHVDDKGTCVGQAIEKPAYEAQMAWLKAQGIDPWQALNLDPLSLAFLLRCATPWEVGLAPR